MRVASLKSSTEPWYRQGWPWFLMAIPAVSVVAGLVTLWLAVSTWDGLVVDDYYQEGKTIEKTLARSERAAELGLVAELSVRSDEVSLSLTAAAGVTLPPTVVLTIAHPTRAGMDQVLLLKPRDGVFVAPVAPLSAGRWLIQMEDESRGWRMNGTVNVPADAVVRIVPTRS
ncbi:FixH family protein [Aromatoleum diolicum]|uniref:Nitrogen fixation protein FixH n=1 Tax=Aromatoleum diolicum TaxID=75796 RepID=A0ABX1Q8C1_9RHOO|nr:FixH family protein [Aromatoleum diolicum]NMG74538.1 nitrogen fixation protein FixH [Aromatoleum diolicum]